MGYCGSGAFSNADEVRLDEERKTAGAKRHQKDYIAFLHNQAGAKRQQH